MGDERQEARIRKGISALLLAILFLLPGCLDGDDSENSSSNQSLSGEITLDIWHTFAAESKEEEVFTNAVKLFEQDNPNVTVEITMVPL